MKLAGLVCGIAVVVAVTGCGGSVPQVHHYVLEPSAVAANPTPHGDGLRVGVRPFNVDPPYDQDRIVYRVDENGPEVGFYAYHRWAAPISRMLPVLVADELRGTPGISTIEPWSVDGVYTSFLEGRVLTIEEVDGPDGFAARVRLDLTLREPTGDVVWSGRLEGRSVTTTEDVAAVVEQMRVALAEAVASGRDDLVAALSAR